MIELWPRGTNPLITDFQQHGIRIHPSESTVKYEENGQFNLEMVVPVGSGFTDFDYGQIIRATVPEQYLAAVNLGEVSYYEVSAEDGTDLLKTLPSSRAVSYAPWEAYRSYSTGDKRSHGGKNWRCTSSHGGLSTPPPDGGWTEIPRSQSVPGQVIEHLDAGDILMKTADFNGDYMEAATLDGAVGYIRISDVITTGETEERTVAARTIKEQNFVIVDVKKTTDGKSWRIYAEHISYQLGRTMLGDCKVVSVTPATALLFIAGAMQDTYGGNLYTDLSNYELTADWSWKNAQSAILDPKSGVVKLTNARVVRDDMDVFILSAEAQMPRYTIRYGANMKSVNWDGDVTGMVTRVYPLAQNEDGSTLLLPEIYIETVRDVPFTNPETLNTGLKVGQKEKRSDGTEVELTESDVISRMREMANNRFNIDKCDMAEIRLDLDWLHMPDTEEYAQYRGLADAAPGDWVQVYVAELGISELIRMTGYTFDPEMERYKGATFGSITQKPTVASYNIKNGSVNASAIALGSITGQHMQAGSITAREIEANSITADKIASRTITTELLVAGAITANEIAAHTITAEEIAAHTITAVEIAAHTISANEIMSHTITADEIEAGAITTVTLAANCVTSDKIQANAITSDTIAAGAVTTSKLDAYAVTAAKLAAGAVTADKIEAGAINADKISATDLTAINAKLGTATIAQAEIATADINFAHIKDLNAESAYFGQTIFDEAVGGKLYVPRLAVGYAQMLGATIGDLVIQASNGNYYAIDVDSAGEVTATQRSVTSAEISAGHTLDGKTLVMGTDILATDLNTENIYASHALMNEITAQLINVDQLWARDAFIGKLMTTDISSNTYIQATIGNWSSGSTITQTINSLDTRISELGYGTIYMQDNEPSHAGLVAGDVWIQTLPVTSWQDIYNNQTDYPTWQAIYDDIATWQSLASMPIMYVWDGHDWQQMYDSLLPEQTATQIQQLSTQISLRATTEQVDALGNTVTQFGAELTVQSQQIEAAVSAVNTKASSYVMWADPRTAYTVSLGDIWVKENEVTDTWQEVYDSAGNSGTWQDIYDNNNTWLELLGAATYVWNGTEWFKTSDRATEIYSEARITETERSITLIASQQATFQGELISQQAQITVVAYEIRQEVIRAQGVENQKISKTSQYQTADSIVAAAEGYVDGILTSKAAIETVATGIVAYVTDAAYQKQSYVEIEQNHVKIKSGGQFLVDSGNFKIETDGSVTVKGSITSTSGKIGGWNIDANNLYSGSGTGYVGLNSNPNNTYAMWAGASNAASAPFRVKRNGDVAIKGQITAESGTIGAWTIGQSDLHAGSGTDYVALKGSGGDWAMWAGDPTAANGKFRVKRDGTVVITKLLVQDPDNPSQTREVNLFSNFYSAVSATISGSWSGNTYHIVATARDGRQIGTGAVSLTGVAVNISSYNPSTGQGTGTVASLQGWSVGITQGIAGLSGIYKDGWNDCRDAMTSVERYTRSTGSYGGESTTHYVYNGASGQYTPVGTGWYQTTRADAYSKPEAK